MTPLEQFIDAVRRFVGAGAPRVDDATLRARLLVCAACPRRDMSATPARCAACGCVIGLKARMATESCPEGRW